MAGPDGRPRWAAQLDGPLRPEGYRDGRRGDTDAGGEFLRAGGAEVRRLFTGQPGFLGQQHTGQFGTIRGAVDE